jgi:prevent-host-death family protein
MCYMDIAAVEYIGVRELRQNASVYLRRVQSGETIAITDRGVPVAMLTPVPPPATRLERLVAQGNATRAAGDLLDLKPFRGAVRPGWASRELQRKRGDRKL